MMKHYVARQRQSDNRWDYTCNGHPTGYCHEFSPIPEDGVLGPHIAKSHNAMMEPLLGNFHTDGHATEREACDCYKKYMLDTNLRLTPEEPARAHQQHHCQICDAWTACMAFVGAYRMFILCPQHQTREHVESLYDVTESWES